MSIGDKNNRNIKKNCNANKEKLTRYLKILKGVTKVSTINRNSFLDKYLETEQRKEKEKEIAAKKLLGQRRKNNDYVKILKG